jgi:hypothetical protein
MRSNLTALFAVALLSLAGGCDGNNNETAGPGRPDGSAKVLPPISVEGTEGSIDLGNVTPGSVHQMIFLVPNPAGKPLAVTKIRSDCACIRAIDPPQTIPAGGQEPVQVRYEAPKQEIPYKTRLILVTDSPDRRIISLWVKSRSVTE